MDRRKTDLIRDNLAKSRRLRRELSEAGDEFVSSLRRIADRGGWPSRNGSARSDLEADDDGRLGSREPRSGAR